MHILKRALPRPHLSLFAAVLLLAGHTTLTAAIPGLTISTLPIGSANPASITVGPDGNLWFVQEYSGSGDPVIGRFDPNGNNVQLFPVATPSGCHGFSIGAPIAGPDGNLYAPYEVIGQACNRFVYQVSLARITTAGVVTLLPPVPNAINLGENLTVGPDNNLWFADSSNARVFRVTTGGVGTEFDLTAPTGFCFGMVAGPDGNLWIDFSSKVVQLAMGGSFKDWPTPDTTHGITLGADGNFWLTEQNNGNVIRLTPAGVMTEFPVASAGTLLTGITANTDGNIWFLEATTRQLDRLLLSSAHASAVSISNVFASGGTGSAVVDKQPLPAGTNSGRQVIHDASANLYIQDAPPPSGPGSGGTDNVYKATVAGCPSITATITTGSLRVGTPANLTISASGGIPPYTFSSANLPPGLAIAGNQVTGTPTQAGSFIVAIDVQDSGGCTGRISATFVVAPACPPIQIDLTFLASAFPTQPQVGVAITGTLTATGGTAPYSFSASTLPPGLTLNGNQISGTPTSAGTYPVTITATDANGCTGQSAREIIVRTPSCNLSIKINMFPFPHVGQPLGVNPTVQIQGGLAPYTFTISGLPPGLSVQTTADTADFTGHLTQVGAYTVVIKAVDALGCTITQTIDVIVNPQCGQATISPSGPFAMIAGSPIKPVQLFASGGTPPYAFSLGVFSLPRGLNISTDGLITGTPTETGIFNVSIIVWDANHCSTTTRIVISVDAVSVDECRTGKILLSGPTNLTAGTPVSLALDNTLLKPAEYSVTGGALPDGLTLTGSRISGTPIKAGINAVVITAKFKDLPNCTLQQTFVFDTAGAVVTPPTCSLGLQVPEQTITIADTDQVVLSQFLTGGTGPYRFTIDAPVDGVAVSGDVLTAHFDTTGRRTVDVTVQDANQCQTHATVVFNVGCPNSNVVHTLDDQPCSTPDLEVIKVHYVKTDSGGGKTIKYQLVLLNKGKTAYNGNVEMTDPLPKEVTGSVTPSEGAVYDATSRTLSFKNPVSLAPGAWTRLGAVDGTLTADDGATITNTATAKVDGVKGPMTVTDQFVVGGAGGDIDVKKQHDGFNRTSTPFIWTIEITNKGKGNLDSLELVELLPPGAVVDEKAFDDNQLGVEKFSVSGSTMRISLKQGAPFFPLAPTKKAIVRIPFKSLPAGPVSNAVLVWGGKASSAAFGRDTLP